jgi:hypothetical protein
MEDRSGPMPQSSYHFDPHFGARFGQRAVSCDERGIERLRQREIGGVIGRHTLPHGPDAGRALLPIRSLTSTTRS